MTNSFAVPIFIVRGMNDLNTSNIQSQSNYSSSLFLPSTTERLKDNFWPEASCTPTLKFSAKGLPKQKELLEWETAETKDGLDMVVRMLRFILR
jgi:hypothetical protein